VIYFNILSLISKGASLASYYAGPIAIVTSAVTGFVAVMKGIDALTTSFDEKIDISVQSTSDAQQAISEVINLRAELDKINSQISNITSKGKLSLADQSDLSNLKSQQQVLNTMLDMNSRIAEQNQQRSAKDARNVLTDTVDNPFYSSDTTDRKTYQEDIEVTQFGLLDKAIAKAKDYQSKIDQINTVLESGKENGKNITDDRRISLEGQLENYKSWIDDTEKYIDESYVTILNERGDFINTESGLPLNEFKADLAEIDSYIQKYDEYYGILNASKSQDISNLLSDDKFKHAQQQLMDSFRNGNELSEEELSIQFPDLVAACEEAGISVQNLRQELLSLSTDEGFSTALEQSFTNTVSSIKEATSNMESLKLISSESMSGTGLTLNSVEAFREMFGADADIALQKTANGYRLNQDALAELKTQQMALTKSDYLSELNNQYSNISYLNQQIAQQSYTGEDVSGLQASRNEALQNISTLQELQYQYETAASAYNTWQAAMSGGEDGDMFDSISNNLDSAKSLYDQGLIGTEEFKAYTDLISNQDLSHASGDEIVSAYEKALPAMESYFNGSKEGLESFRDAFTSFNEETGQYEFNMNSEQLAEELGISIEQIEAARLKMSDYGWETNLETPIINLEELRTAAEEAQTTLQEMGDLELNNINLDADTLTSVQDEFTKVQDYINKIEEDTSLKPDVKTEKLEAANAMLEYLSEQYADLVDSESVSIEINAENLNEFNDLPDKLASLSDDVKINLGIEGLSTDEIRSKIQTGDLVVSVRVNPETGALEHVIHNSDGGERTTPFKAETSSVDAESGKITGGARSVIYSALTGGLPTSFPALTRTVNYVTKGVTNALSTAKAAIVNRFNGNAQAAGTARYGHAYASGDWSVPHSGTSLVGELGQETIVRGGHYFTVGNTGAEFVNLRRGDIVFNHRQTKDLMSKGYVNSRASVYGMAYAGGTIGNISTISSANSSATTVSTASNKTGDALKELTDYFDWLKIRLENVAKETKRAMNAIDNAVGIANKQSQTALALSKTQSEMTVARQGYDKYIAQANSFASKAGLSAGLQKQVQTGTVDISKYDDDTKTKIKEYQDWYNKAQSCLETIEDLKKQEQKLALQRLENIEKYYNAVIAVNKSMQDTNKARMSLSKDLGSGILSSEITNALQSSIKKQQESYDKAAQQLAEYQKEFNDLVAKGYITRDSDAWYDGQKQLEKFTEEMYKSQSALIDFQDQLRELDYTALEQTIDRISDALDRLQNGEKLKGKRDEQMAEDEYLQQLDEVNKSIDANYKLRNAKLEEQALYDVTSDRYNSLAKEIAKIDNLIYSSLNEIESIKDKIVEVRLFDFKQEREDAKDLISELDTFRKFLNDDAFVDKNGVLTGDGFANIALIGQAMAVAKQEIAEYTEGISKLDELLQNGMISTAEYEKQQSEFLKAIKDSALDVESYKESLISLYKTQMKAENSALSESIKLRKQALKSMESYYSYANKVNTQTKDVNAIKAQIAALQGVNNASAQAELKRLQAQLSDAEDSLNETKRQHQNDMIEQGYNEMSDGLVKALDDTLDELIYNADKQEEVVASMLNNIIGMYGSAYGTIQGIIANTGLVGSTDFNQSISKIGSGSGAADIVNSASQSQNLINSTNTANGISTGGIGVDHSQIENELAKAPNTDHRLCAELTFTKYSLSIEEGGTGSVTAAIRPGDAKNKTLSWSSSDISIATVANGSVTARKAGNATITATTTDGSGLSKSCNVTVTAKPKTTPPSTPNSPQGDGIPNVGDKVTFASGLYYEDSYGKGRKGSYNLGKQVYITKINSKGSKPYHISTGTSLGKSDLGWLTLSQIKGYASGTDYTTSGLALFDDTAGRSLDLGSEVIMTSHGVLRQMNAGDMVFNKDQTRRLWEMSQDLSGQSISASKVAAYNVERQVNSQVNIHFDTMLNVEGNATPETLTLADSLIPELADKLGRYVTREIRKC